MDRSNSDSLTVASCLQITDLPRTELRLLLSHLLQQSNSWLIAHDDYRLTSDQQKQWQTLIQRRQAGEPIAYVLGWRGFWDFEVKVTPDVLIPRHETERLVEVALEALTSQGVGSKPAILDLGTGSGIVAIALARAYPQAQVMATDFSEAALTIAQENAQRLQASITFIQSDWLADLPTKLDDASMRFDLIVSNPPYIHAQDIHLQQGDLRYEPSSALTDGEDGLSDLRTIIFESKRWLKPSGCLWLEHGYDQGQAVRQLLEEAGYQSIQTHRDLSDHERVSGGIAPLSALTL